MYSISGSFSIFIPLLFPLSHFTLPYFIQLLVFAAMSLIFSLIFLNIFKIILWILCMGVLVIVLLLWKTPWARQLIKGSISLEACLQLQRLNAWLSWQEAWQQVGRHGAVSENLHPNPETEERERTVLGLGGSFWNLKVNHQWHTSAT